MSGSHPQDAAVLELAEWQLSEVKMAKEQGIHRATSGDPGWWGEEENSGFPDNLWLNYG